MYLSYVLAFLFAFVDFHPPSDTNTNILMLLRWIHLLAGTTWVGLLYFFNLVNVPFQREIDGPTKGKVNPPLLTRALWWFRWGAVVTVLAGISYWMIIVSTDAGNAGAGAGKAIGTFFLIWTVVWAIEAGLVTPVKGALNKGPVLALLIAILVIVGAWLFLHFNSDGWESSRLLSIGIGGGMGWMMLLNVWGIIWRNNKKTIQWTKDNVANGTPIPAAAAKLARQAFLASRTNAFLSIPMLFFMAAASHYPMLGK